MRQAKFIEGLENCCKIRHNDYEIYRYILARDRYALYNYCDIYLTEEEFNTVIYNECHQIDYDLYVNVLNNEMINQSELRQKYIDEDYKDTKVLSRVAAFSSIAASCIAYIAISNNIDNYITGFIFGVLLGIFILSMWCLYVTKDKIDALVYSVKFVKNNKIEKEHFI